MTLVQLLLVVSTVLLALPVVVVLVEVAATHWPMRAQMSLRESVRARTAVLVPAHDEAGGIAASLASVLPQMRAGDRLLVVADNCSDETAVVAAAAGAEVVERFDDEQRGKGYALHHGVSHLSSNPPEVLVMLDADCVLHDGGLNQLVTTCLATDRPVQALDLMLAGEGAGLRERMAEFAWRVKNHLRPLGVRRLGGPCQLMGTGMAFPWRLIANAQLASGHLAEDMQLGIELALSGHAARFEPHALVTSRFPQARAAATRQRTRWEHGHIATLLAQGPKLLSAGLKQRDMQLLALAADLLVPPLALLLLLNIAMAILNFSAAFFVGWTIAAWVSAVALGLLAAAVLLAWASAGRQLISLGELALAPLYALRKLPIYLRFVVGRQVEWVRAKRDGD